MKLLGLSVVFCMFALTVSFSTAADGQLATTRDGIKVSVQIDPQGPSSWIVANVTFINENQYRAEVTWWPVIICESGKKREGAISVVSMNQGETYWVNLERPQACGYGRIKNIDVEMFVKKVSP